MTNIGIIGLGTMGAAFARNAVSKGLKVSIWNRTHEKALDLFAENKEAFYAPENFEDFIESISAPRKIFLFLTAGDAVRVVVEQLSRVLKKDDIILDAGNAYYKDTEAMQAFLNPFDIHFLGLGVSGGEEGARKGPSFMPGGSAYAWDETEEILSLLSATDFSGKACVSYIGNGSAGHYVKMLHNGIEYAEMQVLAEAYDLLKTIYKITNEEIADIFQEFHESDLSSFLLESSIKVLRKKEDGLPLLDLILDKAAQKGTGRWTAEEVLSLGVPAFSLIGAVLARNISGDKNERTLLADLYPKSTQTPNFLLSDFTLYLREALMCLRVSHFQQGFAVLDAANKEKWFDLNFSEIARVWQGGCIIRCSFLKDLELSFRESKTELYTHEFARKILAKGQKSWRLIVNEATRIGVPVPLMSAGLQHFDAYTQARSSAAFIQGLRDFFGSHGYERVDVEGFFHSLWT